MKKIALLMLMMTLSFTNAQDKISANRFFYELSYKPIEKVDSIETVMTILDITEDRSLYKDFTMTAQDSIMKVKIDEMKKTGVYKDMQNDIVAPKFTHRIFKDYVTKEVTYIEAISSGFTPLDIAYKEKNDFQWKIEPQTAKISGYNAQKATTTFRGRNWEAWFTSELPFQDGPYKFHGLPGLIVKIEDTDKHYSWVLKGNKKIEDWHEKSYVERISSMGKGSLKVVDKKRFEKTFNEYKKDPFASLRPMMTREMLQTKMPGSDKTLKEVLRDQEEMVKKMYNHNSNSIEK